MFNDPVVVVFAGINDVPVTVWVPLYIVVVVDAVFTTFTIAITAINIKLKGLFALAETVGQRPHIFMQSILEKGDLFDHQATIHHQTAYPVCTPSF